MLLYEYDYADFSERESKFDVRVKKIKPFDLYIDGEKKNIKAALLRLQFWLVSKGNFRIYYVFDDEKNAVMHTSYVVGYCPKVDFLSKGDIQIGPCHTPTEYRGKGLYKSVLNFINKTESKSAKKAYMMVSANNIPSVKGIEAAGFKAVGNVVKNKTTKTYTRTK